MSNFPSTKTAPPSQRGGTYERDSATQGLLRYGTDTIHDLRRDRRETTFGSADDCDIQMEGEFVSRHHGRIEHRARGTILLDDSSKNATWLETRRAFGVRLRPSFDDVLVPAAGTILRPGTTFVVGDTAHRYIAIDAAIREQHTAVLDILGTEDEVRAAASGEGDPTDRVSPCDFILAADGSGHMVITGPPDCGQEELAHVVHKVSKRRGQGLIKCQHVPVEREAQMALLRDEAAKATLLLDLMSVGDKPVPIDPFFIEAVFSTAYQVRVIVLARTAKVASVALGDIYLRAMLPVALHAFEERRGAVQPILDRWFATHGSPLRLADLTPENQRRILRHDWRSFERLRETAYRLAAVVRAPSLNQARIAVGVKRNTFYAWFKDTLGLTMPLVAKNRWPALAAALGRSADGSSGGVVEDASDEGPEDPTGDD